MINMHHRYARLLAWFLFYRRKRNSIVKRRQKGDFQEKQSLANKGKRRQSSCSQFQSNQKCFNLINAGRFSTFFIVSSNELISSEQYSSSLIIQTILDLLLHVFARRFAVHEAFPIVLELKLNFVSSLVYN